MFLGFYFTERGASLSPWIAVLVFLAGLAAMSVYNYSLKLDAESQQPLKNLNRRMLKAEEAGDRAALEPLLIPEFKILRADGKVYDRKQYLDDVPTRKNRGRSVDEVEVQVGWHKAVLTCRVMTTRDGDGKSAVGHFKNTQKFVQRGAEWQCTDWKVVKMEDD